MDSAALREVRELAKQLADVERRLRDQEGSPQLGNSSIEDGSLDEYDGIGNLVGRVGKQHDGTHGAVALAGPVPPTPTQPVLEGGVNGMTVFWDGYLLNFGGDVVPQPLDLAAVEVWAALGRPPVPDAFASERLGTITATAGGAQWYELPAQAGEWFVSLRARSTPGRVSAMTVPVATIITTLGSVIGQQLDELGEIIAGDLVELDAKLDGAIRAGEDAAAAARKAEEAALEAARVAAGKGRVIALDTEPAPEQDALWIDTSDGNRPYVMAKGYLNFDQIATSPDGQRVAMPGIPGAGSPTTGSPRTSLSVEWWAWYDGWPRRAAVGMFQFNGSGHFEVDSGVTDSLRFRPGNTPTAFNPGVPMPVGRWVHFAFVWDFEQASARLGRVFVDGVERANTVDLQGTTQYGAGHSWNIGDSLTGQRAWHGRLRDIRLWAGVRSTEQVQASMAGDSALGQEGLLGWWDEPEGNVLPDLSGNGRHGQIVGTKLPVVPRRWVPVDDARIEAAAKAAADAGEAAGKAVSAASTAQEKADAAEETAKGARTTADAAEKAALEAAGVAAGKGRVIYTAAEAELGENRNAVTLWIDGGTPKRWDGQQWTVLTDSRITDAARQAAEAEQLARDAAGAADAAFDQASAAHHLAGEALTNAHSALTSANQRNQLFRSTAAPSGDGQRVGDMWWRFADTNFAQVIGTWMWSGSGWVASQFGHQVLGSVDIGSLTVVGQATLAQAVIDRLWADVVLSRKITTDMLRVGTGNNLVPDQRMETPAAWTQPSWLQDTGGRLGGGSILVPASSTQQIAWQGTAPQDTVAVKPGEQMRMRAWFTPSSNVVSNRVGIFARFRSTAGVWGSAVSVALNDAAVPANTASEVSGTVTIPAGSTHVAMGLVVQAAHAAAVRFTDHLVQGMTDASLVADGAVLARHLRATAIDGMTITGATIQTTATLSRGVKIDSSGIRAYRWDGREVFYVDNNGNVAMQGSFSAGDVGEGRVQIYTEPVSGRGALQFLDSSGARTGIMYTAQQPSGTWMTYLLANEVFVRGQDNAELSARPDATGPGNTYGQASIRAYGGTGKQASLRGWVDQVQDGGSGGDFAAGQFGVEPEGPGAYLAVRRGKTAGPPDDPGNPNSYGSAVHLYNQYVYLGRSWGSTPDTSGSARARFDVENNQWEYKIPNTQIWVPGSCYGALALPFDSAASAASRVVPFASGSSELNGVTFVSNGVRVPAAGLYKVSANARAQNSNSAWFDMAIRLSSGASLVSAAMIPAGGGTFTKSISTALVRLSANAIVQLLLTSNVGSTPTTFVGGQNTLLVERIG